MRGQRQDPEREKPDQKAQRALAKMKFTSAAAHRLKYKFTLNNNNNHNDDNQLFSMYYMANIVLGMLLQLLLRLLRQHLYLSCFGPRG